MHKEVQTTILKDSNLVVQGNGLVNARYKLTLQEGRLLYAAMGFITSQDEDFKKYKIKVSDLANYLGISGGNIYNSLRKITHGLITKSIIIEKKEGGFKEFPLLTLADYTLSDNSVVLQFHPEMKPFLLQQNQKFTQARLEYLTKYGSAYTARIYLFLKEYLGLKKRSILVEELKNKLELEDYEYSDLKRRVLFRAQGEMECYSDVSFEFVEHKKNKKVYKLTFSIYPNIPFTTSLPATEEVSVEVIDPRTEIEEAFARILFKRYNVSKNVGLKLAKDHVQFAPAIFNCINATLSKTNLVQNIAGYVVNVIKENEYEFFKDKAEGYESFAKYKKILNFDSFSLERQYELLSQNDFNLEQVLGKLSISDCQENYLLYVLEIKDKDIEKKARAAREKIEESISNKTPVVDHSRLLTQLGQLFVNNFGAAIFEKWLGELRIYKVSENEIIFQARDKFLRDWIIREFIETKQMLKVVNQALPEIKKVSVICLAKKA